MEEEWRPVVGWEDYYSVSSTGRVRSDTRKILRSNGVPQTIPMRVMKQVENKLGYKSLHLTRDGKPVGWQVHRLVAFAFLGEPPEGKNLVLHGLGGPGDNSVENIRWGNHKENMQDAEDEGTANFWGHKTNPKYNCPSGHPYEGSNLYIDPRGRRVCRTCKREWARRKHGYAKERYRV